MTRKLSIKKVKILNFIVNQKYCFRHYKFKNETYINSNICFVPNLCFTYYI